MVLKRALVLHRSPSVHSVKDGSAVALKSLLAACSHQLPGAFLHHVTNVQFSTPTTSSDEVCFPCPLREQEAVAAIKALEACAAAALADLRFGPHVRAIEVDLAKTTCFLMSAYLATIDGMDKANPRVKGKVPNTDLNSAQSLLYRRLSANLYETKTAGEYYHIHGSLEASRTLEMIGLPPYRPDLTDYRECIRTIETAVKRFTTKELEEMNRSERQAGTPVLKVEQFRESAHGRLLLSLPPFTTKPLEQSTKPVPLPPASDNLSPGQRQTLRGVKVLELCRVIAGPTIGRSLAAHGATVLKVTCPDLPDVPFFQVDVNTGKHTTSLNLRDDADRATFECLLATADVVVDGYRPGVIDHLGYGQRALTKLAARRGRGFVYVAEDCFGGTGTPGARPEWASRPGWQQIADCVTGVAWEQGRFMGLDEPVVPPFPMSDYGTGALGCVAALTGLYLRATKGGSWACRTSLCQYDVFLLSLGLYARDIQERLRRTHDKEFFELRHYDSVDEVGKRALNSVRRLHPSLFDSKMMNRAWSHGFGAEVCWPKEAVTIDGVRLGHVRATRPNGFDSPTWEGWEEDEEVSKG